MKIPFIGGAYQGRSLDINAQLCINLFPELDDKEAKNVIALYGTPGMVEFASIGSAVEIRGLHVVGSFLYMVAGNSVYKVSTDGSGANAALGGTLSTTTGHVHMVDNGTELMIVDPGVEGYIYETVAGGNVTAIADADFPTPDTVTFLDGYFIISKNASGEFWISASYDGTSWDALDYATAESNPDNLVTVISDHGELWLFGKKSIEVWYNSGAADFPFERVSGVFIQQGLGARDSVVQLDNSIFWLSNRWQVIRADGYSPRIVSTRHIDYIISTYTVKSDAIGFSYYQDGHAFYVLTFPSAGRTWVYDASTNYWHQRRSYPVTWDGDEGRHRANCYAFFNNKHIIGDFEDGKLYEWDMDTYTDGGEVIRRIRRAPVIHSDRKLIFFNQFEIDFEGGVGLTTGQGSDPQVMLRWSDDNGHTFGHEHWSSIGKIGEYNQRAIWRRLGRSRNRVFEATVSDPVKVVMINAHLEAMVGGS